MRYRCLGCDYEFGTSQHGFTISSSICSECVDRNYMDNISCSACFMKFKCYIGEENLLNYYNGKYTSRDEPLCGFARGLEFPVLRV